MRCILVFNLLVAGLLVGCASSSSRLVAPPRSAINPAQVRIYRVAPRHYQEIAFLDATSGARFFHGSPEGEADALQRLRIEAAKVGANGVLITLVGDRPSGSLGIGVGGAEFTGAHRSVVGGSGSVSGGAPLVSNGAQGIAIYVPEQR